MILNFLSYNYLCLFMQMYVVICGPHHTCGGQRTTSHEGPGNGTQVGKFGSKCPYCWSILPGSIFYVALIGLIGLFISNMFPPQKCQLPRVPGPTFVALTFCGMLSLYEYGWISGAWDAKG